ncbi:MAG: T9SS type A sorting domain-containing protein [Balneolaceae bacterium]
MKAAAAGILWFMLYAGAYPGEAAARDQSPALRQLIYTEEILKHAERKMDQTLADLSYNSGLHPAHTDPATGEWIYFSREQWTSGFFAGSLWHMYQLTGDTRWREYATEWTLDMEPMAYSSSDHDTGFRILSSFGRGMHLTGRRHYQRVVLQAAASLAKRFNPEIGAIKSWEPWEGIGNYPVIIDNLMNLELLFTAAEIGGVPEWHDIAVKHAQTSLKHHMRPDGSTYHIVDFDDEGKVNRKFTTQGYDTDSVWARGQAWAVYGFTMVYRFTRQAEFLDAAIAAAEYFTEHLPEDRVPVYDFRETVPSLQTRDASAAAIISSALLELFSFTQDSTWFSSAQNILDSLSAEPYMVLQPGQSSILGLSTLHRGAGGHGTAYADYYFLEALIRFKEATGENFPELLNKPEIYLEQNYPNPFSGRTTIFYTIENAGPVTISVYDIAGRQMLILLDDFLQAGTYNLNAAMTGFSSGIYFCVLRSGGEIRTKKMLLIR